MTPEIAVKGRRKEPRNPLAKAFEQWLGDVCGDSRYSPRLEHEKATRLVRGLYLGSSDAAEVTALLPMFRDHPLVERSGPFLTAAFSMLPADVLVYENPGIEAPVWDVGCRLAPGKTLVLRADTKSAGFETGGKVLNYANCGYLGPHAKNMVFNYRTADNMAQSIEAPAFNFGEAEEAGEEAFCAVVNCGRIGKWLPMASGGLGLTLDENDFSGYIIKPKHQTAEVTAYLQELVERIGPQRGYQEVVQELGSMDIKGRLRELLTASIGLSVDRLGENEADDWAYFLR